jgi:WhiB family transcriptional regulator, redox-sensing transcriptional regulator
MMPNGSAAPPSVIGVSGFTAGGHRGNWRKLAACQSAELELFFPAIPADLTGEQAARAKAVCGACPVRRECLQFALATRQSYGVWGGMTERERRVAHAPARA